ncbi:MAG: ATP-binding protein [Acidobacteriota bacterium]
MNVENRGVPTLLTRILLRERGAFLLAVVYLVLAGAYIWVSGHAVKAISGQDAALLHRLEILKGWGFVLLTAVALYAILRMVVRAAAKEKQVSEELLRVHERLKLLVEANPHFFFYTQDREGNVTYVSPSVEAITGRPVSEWLKHAHWWTTDNPINEEARRKTRKHLAGEFDGKPMLVEILHPSGRRVLLEAFEAPLHGPRGFEGIQGVAHDVTTRRRGELLQQFFVRVTQAAGEAKALEALLAQVHRELRVLLPAENFYVALWDGSGPEVRFPYVVDQKDPPPAPRPPRRGLTEYVIRTGKPLLLGPEEDAQLVAAGEVELIGSPAVSWMGAPLQVAGKTLGCMVVQSYDPNVRYFPEDLEVLSLAAREVGQVLHRFELQQQLAETAAKFQTLVDLSPDAILIHQDGVIKFANRAAARLWGAKEPGDLVGRPALGLVAPDFRETVKERVRRSLESGQMALPLVEEFLRLDGTTFRGEASATPITFQGRPAIEVVIRDVSEREKTEALLREAQKMEAIGALAGGIAHDFNNLLQAFSALLFSLKSKLAGASVGQELQTLEGLVQRGASLARQLLLFARREISRREALDLNELVKQMEELLRRLLPANIFLELNLAADPVVVEADPNQLNQVLLNLVVNAKDAMPEGGKLELRVERRGDEALLAVSDNGCGIPEEVLPRIFEPFFSTKGPEKGTGLGLAVVHGIVTQHGGRVEVESAVGRGSTFTVVLPTASAPLAPQTKAISGSVPPVGSGQRVLVVEDEEAARHTLADVLQALGYQVVAVGSAEEAGQLPATPAFDVLLTDFLLPGASGAQLAAGLVERWPQLKVIVMSGYAEDQVFKEQVSRGQVHFLQKPFTMETLARVLAAALADQKG